MNPSNVSASVTSPQCPAISKEPWDLQAEQSYQGESSVICDAQGFVICSIPAPVWDTAGALKNPQDASNVRLLLASPKMLKALRKAEKALDILADEHEQETEITEAGGWATDALRVVREAIRDAEPPTGVTALFRVVAKVVLTADDIEAFDTEAAQRYAEESLAEVRGDIDNIEVNLGFADGKMRDAIFSLPSEIEADAALTDGREGDPDNTMEHGVFEIEVSATVEFDVEAPAGATPAEIIARAHSLLSPSEAVNRIAFDDGCMGAKLKLASPMNISMAND